MAFSRQPYAPNKTQAVWDACWRKGYIRVVIGGGLSSCVQVCDTKLHGDLSRDYVDGETIMLMIVAGRHPDFLPALKREDCVGLLRPLWEAPERHVTASRGFKENMLTNSFDGTEDALASTAIARLWHDLNMDSFRKQAIEEATAFVTAEGFVWSSMAVQDLVGAYQETGFLDEIDDDEGDLIEDDPGANSLLPSQFPATKLNRGTRKGCRSSFFATCTTCTKRQIELTLLHDAMTPVGCY